MLKIDQDHVYTLKKIGNRDEPENHNQDRMYHYTGALTAVGREVPEGEPTIDRTELRCGDVAFLDCVGGSFFHTSRVRSIYIHDDESHNDKLVLPSNFPNASDLKIPELNKGDVLLGTMNSVYLCRKEETIEEHDAKWKKQVQDVVDALNNKGKEQGE